MPVDDEIRGLKRELASSSSRGNTARLDLIVKQLAARGVVDAGAGVVEKRAPGRPKKQPVE